MRDAMRTDEASPASALRSATWIVLAGVALGVAYNALGLGTRKPWGLAWIGRDALAELSVAPTVAGTEASAVSGYATDVSDPLAVPRSAGLPEIPAAGRPVQIELPALVQLVDARAALVLDARDPEEFAAGHIPGALNLPYDLAASDPTRIEALDAAGRPIVTYCGGGTCEASLSLAHELIGSGFPRVAVFMDGFPAWVAAGHPVERPGAEGG